MTKGEYRVGISFNPSNSGEVAEIKEAAARLIDQIGAISIKADQHGAEADPQYQQEVARLKALAQTGVEEAAMWAVKAATKPVPEGDV